MSLYFNNAKRKLDLNFIVMSNVDLYKSLLDGSVKSVSIPSSVKSLPGFSGCTSLETITFEEPCQIKNFKYRGFENCSALTEITIPNSITSIGSYCFSGCKQLSSVTFEEPCQITEIPGNCFYLTNLKSFKFPSSVKTFGLFALSYCPELTSIIVSNTIQSLPDAQCFEGCPKLSEIIFEEPCQIKKLPYYCFYNLPSLTEITIPSSVTSMNTYCFADCPNLTTITINKPTDSISGAPWGATNATVIWNG